MTTKIKWCGLALTALLASCGGDSPTTPTPPLGQQPPPAAPVTILAAGDIGQCGQPGPALTARLLDQLPGIVLALGDLAYMNGTYRQFIDCYAPTWGRHRDRTRPAPGNHDYETAGASGYFAYFEDLAGPEGDGFYSFVAGGWRVISLNSNVPMGPGSPQHAWLQHELQAPARCTLAYWHHPLISSGPNGDNPNTKPLWDLLYAANADVVLVGHDHIYERFVPQDPEGRMDRDRGLRQFVVGTGGASLTGVVSRRPNSAASHVGYGVLKMVLGDNRYEWQFMPVEGTAFSDAGFDVCH